MIRIIQYIRNTLSARICWWVLLSVTILFVAALLIMFRYSHNAIEKESLAKAEQMLNGKVMDIENMLHRVNVATTNMRWNVEQHLDDPDAMVKYTMQVVRSNPDIVGCAIAFEPNYYPQKGELYMTYAFRPEPESDEILLSQDPTIIQPNEFKSVPYVAVNMNRYGIGIELNSDYFRDGVGYLKAADIQKDAPTLFDFIGDAI